MVSNRAARRLQARQGSNGGSGGPRVAGVSQNKAAREIAVIVAAARRIITRNGILQEGSRRRMTAFLQRQKCRSVTSAFWTRGHKIVRQAVRESLQRSRTRLSIYRPQSERPILQEVLKQNRYKFVPGPGCVLKQDDVLCDIGAHVGISTALALKTVRRAVAVEPWPRTLRILKKNLVSFGSKVRVIGKAVGQAPSSIMYPHRGAKKKGTSSNAKPSRLFFCSCYTGRPHGKGIEVPSVNLQDLLNELCGEWAPTVLKLDCEGAGRKVLNVCHFNRLRLIVMEADFRQWSYKGYSEVRAHLARNGWRFPVVSCGDNWRTALSKRERTEATSSLQRADVAFVQLRRLRRCSYGRSEGTPSCKRQRTRIFQTKVAVCSGS